MKILTLLLLLATQIVNAQKFITLYSGLNNTYTLVDATRQNNPYALGVFVSAYANTGGWLRPTAEVTGDVFVKGDDIKFPNGFDGIHPSMKSMITVMGGASIQFEKFLSAGFVTGPAFVTEHDYINTRNTLWAVKPHIDITPGKGKVSFRLGYIKTNTRVEFSSVRRYKAFTLAVGIRLL